jgi:HEPN domain-containing protein
MKPPDVALRGLVLQWLDKVAADFDAAEQLCAMGGRFREIIAFLCQQAVEKYLKALLVRHQIEFPKTHDIAKLLDRLTRSHPSEWKCDTRATRRTFFQAARLRPSTSPAW